MSRKRLLLEKQLLYVQADIGILMALRKVRGMSDDEYRAYEGASPYFSLIRRALGELVDGHHFFDVFAEDAIFEVLYEFPGWPRIIEGRSALMAMFAGYVQNMTLHAADHLAVSQSADGRVLTIEYEVHGSVRSSGALYDNRFCSIVHIRDRKIVHWRDYMDSLAAWNAITGKTCRPIP